MRLRLLLPRLFFPCVLTDQIIPKIFGGKAATVFEMHGNKKRLLTRRKYIKNCNLTIAYGRLL